MSSSCSRHVLSDLLPSNLVLSYPPHPITSHPVLSGSPLSPPPRCTDTVVGVSASVASELFHNPDVPECRFVGVTTLFVSYPTLGFVSPQRYSNL